jgi:pimeloyl-ACP methyl ester carboxylesterase
MESHTIKGLERVGNIEIYFEYDRIDDSLPTLVLLHGFLSSSFSFRKLVPHLIKEYNVISIDLPPFGQSGKDYRYTYSFRNIAKSVVMFLEGKGIRKFSIIGHSMGGQISLQLIKSYPDLFGKNEDGQLPAFLFIRDKTVSAKIGYRKELEKCRP